MSNITNKLQISPYFKATVRDCASVLLNSNDNQEFSNHELIENGKRIAKVVIPELRSETIHTLMSFHTSEVSHIVLSSGQKTVLPETPYDGFDVATV